MRRRVTLEIITITEGETTTFSNHAVLDEFFKGSELVTYFIEQDAAQLIYSEDGLEMKRGAGVLSATFREGEESAFFLGSGEYAGRIPIKTTRYRLQVGEAERDIELCYQLLDEPVQTFSLRIRILFSEEK